MPVEEFRKAPFIRLLFPLVGGIILGRQFIAPAFNEWMLPAIAGGFILASLLCHRNGFAAILPFFLLVGMILGREPSVRDIPDGIIAARVCEEIIPSGNGARTLIDRIHLSEKGKWVRVEGRASVYLAGRRDRAGSGGPGLQNDYLRPGTYLFARCRLSPYKPPMNPFQFDFGSFQRGRGIYYQTYLDSTSLVHVVEESGKPASGGIRIRAIQLRRSLIEKLETKISGDAEREILKALLLGYREEMDPAVSQNFARSGTLHILAVSGLHVGILYLLPALLLKRLIPYRIAGIAGSILVFGGLWMYAFLTGLSSSVVRAVFMCCIHGIAVMSRRKVSPLHVVSLTAFIMILSRPAAVFEAGFQLSFAAVTGIFFMYNRFLALFPFTGILGRWVSRLVSVSLAAQLATMPLAVYYFHKVAPASVLSNLVVIPLATGILYTGLFFFLSAGIGPVADFLASLLGRLGSFLEWFTRSVADLPVACIDGLSLVPSQVILIYLCGASVLLYLRSRTARSLFIMLSMLILYLAATGIRELRIQAHHGVYVFEIRRETAILFVNGRHSTIFMRSRSGNPPGFKENSVVTDNTTGRMIGYEDLPYGIESFFYRHKLHPPVLISSGSPGMIHSPGMEGFYSRFKSKNMLVLSDWNENYCSGLPAMDIDILVLCHNPKIHIPLMESLLNPALIIADGSNYSSYSKRIESECREAGIPFYTTGTRGCFFY